MRSIIVGGGVGGCALAAALSRFQSPAAGPHSRVILERRASGASGGMGFILMPNGLEALATIAPERDWSALGRTICVASLRSSNGDTLAEHELEPSVCVARECFLQALRDEALADTTTIMMEGVGFESMERDTRGFARAVVLEKNARLTGDAYFGADGARSKMRSALFPSCTLSDAAIHEVVSVADAPDLARELGSTFRKFHDPRGGLAVGMLAESASRVVWFMQMDASRYPISTSDAPSLASFADVTLDGWPSEVSEAIATTNFAQSHLWKTRDLAPLPTLHECNIALLGDAAHACLPFTSQGANGALVDAALLAQLLKDVESADGAREAFEVYSELRRPHHRRMFMEGRRLRASFLEPLGLQSPALPLVA
jgi:2-polyprenyl-6-methoxyphenol hydroxylase-like FAD-dependent oxidoreductase